MQRLETINASDVRHGDTLVIDGKMHTISRNDIHTGLFGTTIRGENFIGGVQRVLFPKWHQGKIVDYQAQV